MSFTLARLMPHPEGDKHHYLPKFYLKQWAGSDRRLSEFTRPYKSMIHRRKSPNSTGYQRGLHTFNQLPPALASYIGHRFLQYTDDAAYSSLCKLLDGDLQFNISICHDKRARSAGFAYINADLPERPVHRQQRAVRKPAPRPSRRIRRNFQRVGDLRSSLLFVGCRLRFRGGLRHFIRH